MILFPMGTLQYRCDTTAILQKITRLRAICPDVSVLTSPRPENQRISSTSCIMDANYAEDEDADDDDDDGGGGGGDDNDDGVTTLTRMMTFIYLALFG
jgi:hypothetical protein